MPRAVHAGALYALIVFLIGFVLGTIRVLLIVPRIGEAAAVVLEAPLMLVASWLVCRRSVDRLRVPRAVGARSVMGTVAFAVLTAMEFGLAVVVFGRSAAGYLAAYGSAPGIIGLVAQVFFAFFPVVEVWRR